MSSTDFTDKPPLSYRGFDPVNDDPEYADLRSDLRRLHERLEAEEKLRHEILASTSWRVTSPLRSLKRLFMGRKAPVELPVPAQIESPQIPVALRRFHGSPVFRGGVTYSMIDAADAMRPLLIAATASMEHPRLRIAFIGSDELCSELSFDADIVRIESGAWRSSLSMGEFDLLLVESVLNAGSEWRYFLIEESGGTQVTSLVDHCRSISLPSVLWIREDPTSYQPYAWLAGIFDIAYAIDEGVRDILMATFPDKRISFLPPAIQPALHNPYRSKALQESTPTFRGKILFDGWWDLMSNESSRKFVEDACGSDVRVCESAWEIGASRLADRPELSGVLLGCVDAVGKIALNKIFPLELFLDTAVGGWRKKLAMMRAVACGTQVVMSKTTGNSLIDPAHERTRVHDSLLPELRRSSEVHLARRSLLQEHCIADRLRTMGTDTGVVLPNDQATPKVAMILVTMRPSLLEPCFERFRSELYPNRELIVILHGSHDVTRARGMIHAGESITVHEIPSTHTLGACLNFGIAMSSSPYWSKVDDDDAYGPNYLSDMMLSRRMIDFDVAGKPLVFTYLEEDDGLYWDPDWHACTHMLHPAREGANVMVAGATLVGKREVVEQVPFSETRKGGADSDFIRRCYSAGYSVLATDGFNFVCHRSRRAGFHTWKMDESEMKRRASKVGNAASLSAEAFI